MRIQIFVDQANNALSSIRTDIDNDTIRTLIDEFKTLYDAFKDFDNTFPSEPRIDELKWTLEEKRQAIIFRDKTLRPTLKVEDHELVLPIELPLIQARNTLRDLDNSCGRSRDQDRILLSGADWKRINPRIQSFVDEARIALNDIKRSTLTETSNEFNELYDAFVKFDKAFPSDTRIDDFRQLLENKKIEIKQWNIQNQPVINNRQAAINSIKSGMTGVFIKRALNDIRVFMRDPNNDISTLTSNQDLSFLQTAYYGMLTITKTNAGQVQAGFAAFYKEFNAFHQTYPLHPDVNSVRKVLDNKKLEFYPKL
jgi:hypothetical protein